MQEKYRKVHVEEEKEEVINEPTKEATSEQYKEPTLVMQSVSNRQHKRLWLSIR